MPNPHLKKRPTWPTVLGIGVGIFSTFLPLPVFSDMILNLDAPQSFVADPAGEGYFIANANGEPGERDNNGFISKLDREGQLIKRQFIQGGKGTTILHSPNGMVIVGNTLYVADLDTVRGFDKTTGEPVVTVPFTRYDNPDLAGLTSDRNGLLYITDTAGNGIYRIDPAHKYAVSVFVQDEALGNPRGVALHPRTGHLIVVSWKNGTILEVDAAGSITELVSNSFFSSRFHNLDGIDFDSYGNMYVSDLTAGKVWRIRPNQKMEVIAEFLISPASLGVDRDKHLILVPYLYGNGAEINGLEKPTVPGEKRKKRTLADYGLKWLESEPDP